MADSNQPQPAKPHFFVKLIPPRPDFASSMSESERALMGEHVRYWRNLMDRGFVVVYGPVLDPADNFGMGVVRVDSEAQLRVLLDQDPTVLAGLNRIEYRPMKAVYPGA